MRNDDTLRQLVGPDFISVHLRGSSAKFPLPPRDPQQLLLLELLRPLDQGQISVQRC
jgi:hypothetical protein